jgi:hypothetical protein
MAQSAGRKSGDFMVSYGNRSVGRSPDSTHSRRLGPPVSRVI